MKHISQKNRLAIWMIALFLSFASPLLADEPYAPPTYRGKVILVVDKTMAADPTVSSNIDRLTQDLAGDGWRVLRDDVDRGPYQYNPDWSFNTQWAQQNAPAVREIRALIQADYDAPPYEVKAVFLIGHVAVPYSGTNTYGDHPVILGAQPTDAFYGEMEALYGLGGWSDSTVTKTNGPVVAGNVWNLGTGNIPFLVTLTNVPGDGKFDQTNLPAPMELGVGRLDLSAMPAFANDEVVDNEAALLCQYLDKDHDFRCGILSVQRQGIYVNLLNDAWAGPGADVGMMTILGYDKALHPKSTGSNPLWFPNVSGDGQDCLLGEFYTTGGGFLWSASQMGETFCGFSQRSAQSYWLQHDPRSAAFGLPAWNDCSNSFDDKDSRVVFLNIMASYIGCWNEPNSILRAPLANAYDPANGKFGYGLGVIYTTNGTGTATLTKRSLGATIGEALFPGYAGDITINLMGDPTLRLYVVLPPSDLTASCADGTVTLNWTASSDSSVLGYNIYCAPTDNGPYTLVNTTGPVTGSSYIGASPPPGDPDPDNFYMVRTVKLETTPIGSYTNMSEGVITNVNVPGTVTPYLQILSGPANAAIPNDDGSDGATANSAAFTVDAAGIDASGNEELAYQWYINGVALSDRDGSHISGSTTRALLIKGVQTSDEGDYYVVVSLADGSDSVTSASASLLDTNIALPTISITAPANGNMYVTPANITITANAANNDGDGIAPTVYFFQCGYLIGTGTQVPNTTTWTIPWNNVPPGTYTLTAKATDDNGAVKTSAANTVIVEAPGTVYITNPVMCTPSTTPFKSSINKIAITAHVAISDGGTLPTVNFYHDNTLIGTGTQVSNTSTWTNTWNNVPPGIYNLTAQAIGDWGTTTSAAVTVIVETPPTVSITSPAPGYVFPPQANIYIAANVKVNYDSTITRVDFYYNTTHGGRTLIGTVTTAPYSITWNNVPPGYYGISAQATDNNNLPGTSPNVDITVGTPPTVLITSPANGAVFLPSTNTNITANATASDGTVTQVVFYTNGVPIGTNTTAPYSIAWNNVQPGTYSLTAKATDNYGLATTSDPVSVRVDAPPTVSITSPTNGAVFLPPTNITIMASAGDSDGTVSQVVFYTNGVPIGTATTAPYSIAWNNVPPGTYSLTAQATDNDGAVTTSAPVSVRVDTPPTVSITSPANMAVIPGPTNITITANAADSDGTVSRVDFYQGATLIGTGTQVPNSSTWTFTWANVSHGTYTLTAKAIDNDGAITTSVAVTIFVDFPPTVSITSPVNNAVFLAPANITVTANAADSDGHVMVVLFYQGTTQIGLAYNAPYSITWTNVPPGTYTLTAQAIDNQGVATTSTAVSVRVDAPPTVSITSPTNMAVIPGPTNITLTASAADSDGTVTQLLFYQSINYIGAGSQVPNSSTWTFTWNNVPCGTDNLTAKAIDNNGAITTSAAVTIFVDAPPTASITSPTNNAVFSAPANITINANAADSDGHVMVVLFYQGTTLIGHAYSAPYSIAWNNVSSGTYNLTAQAIDDRGVATTSTAVTIHVQ